MEGFTEREVQDACLAREAQLMVGVPSERDFKSMVSSSQIKNLPFKPDSIPDACCIYGPAVAGVQGKTVRQKPTRVDTAVMDIPRELRWKHRHITMTADIMFVNGWAFFTSLLRRIRLRTAEYTPTRTAKQLGSLLKRVIDMYFRAGYVVTTVLMDQEFECVRSLVPIRGSQHVHSP
jgi:hypothetical protein